ncbi:MAG: TldD/PmbA family protein [Acidobacteria bacterium]|nr:TldD/PmbA family protein [Acidobacteriota bacterium]
MVEQLKQIAADVIKLAQEAGATGVECNVSQGEEFDAQVRRGEVEQVKESGSRGAGIRVLFGRNTGSSYTSDLTPEGLRMMVRQAVDLAKITTEDPHAGLPDAAELGQIAGDLQLASYDLDGMEAAAKIALAQRAEAAALSFDARITNSEGGSFGSRISRHAFANSLGFVGGYETTSCSISAVPVAQHEGRMERDYWFHSARGVGQLESPEHIGRRAAERVIRRLGSRKVPTQQAPVIFEPRVARSLLGHIFEAVNGDAIYRRASFLQDKLGERVASAAVTVVDDATIPGLFGSAPYDDEGVPSRRTVVIEKGVLKSYLLNTYTARKLGMKTTGNASRGLTGNASIGQGNLYIEKGAPSVAELLRQAGTGFYVTELMGFGVNAVTGDYSRGASGLWVENGEIAFPVAEVTIAGNLKDMLTNIEAVADDLEFRGAVASPTLLIGGMTISGT